MQGNSYSDLKVYGKSMSEQWFVGFKFYCAKRNKTKRCHQVRLGVNYQATVRGRIIEGESVRKVVERCLKEGWNPFDCDVKSFIQSQQVPNLNEIVSREDPRNLPFNEAMQWAYNKKDNKKGTLNGLRSGLKYIKLAASSLGFDNISIQGITRFHVCEILDEMKTIRQAEYDISTNKRYIGKKFTPNQYNAFLDRASALFFEFENRGIIEFNPCHKIAKKDEIDFGIHKHASAQEVDIIKRELPQKHAELYNFLRFEYVLGMRPDEILDTKFSMVDYLNSTINISDALYNNRGELISKTTAYRQVPVPGYLLDWIKERAAGGDPDRYLFSYKLKPGYHRLSRCWISMLWLEHVIEGLGINVSLYSFKGKGGDAKRDAGIDLAAVSAGYGHNNTSMARNIYLTGEGERLRNQIIEKAPDL
ncbi:tyrosine-type recombinase/integrase [Chitinophaga sp. RCC_12]|uniref:tyrosine-type recombinase/integrase n=1 Tax=Chitinophaga sp. RCC_12 TaxID=3239226 RepID=UPI0035240D99